MDFSKFIQAKPAKAKKDPNAPTIKRLDYLDNSEEWKRLCKVTGRTSPAEIKQVVDGVFTLLEAGDLVEKKQK